MSKVTIEVEVDLDDALEGVELSDILDNYETDDILEATDVDDLIQEIGPTAFVEHFGSETVMEAIYDSETLKDFANMITLNLPGKAEAIELCKVIMANYSRECKV